MQIRAFKEGGTQSLAGKPLIDVRSPGNSGRRYPHARIPQEASSGQRHIPDA
jgi:hypothetical protein